MNITELANVFFIVVILIAGIPVSASDPCTEEKCQLKYKNFVRRHVLQTDFDRNSLSAWENYLKKQQLWCRTSTQSFMEAKENVEDICTSGLRVKNGGNLCISRSEMKVYDVRTTKDNNGCRIDVSVKSIRVIVACDKVGNRCLPVHYEGNQNRQASGVPCLPKRYP